MGVDHRVSKESAMDLIARAGDCEDGNCPRVSDVAGDDAPPGMAAVRGRTYAVHGDESTVFVPRALLLEYAAEVRAETT
jgi:hypothetical protein